jgi:hypothetical protein
MHIYIYIGDAEGPSVDAVITVSPRRDHAEYDDDLPEALVTVTCQVFISYCYHFFEFFSFWSPYFYVSPLIY